MTPLIPVPVELVEAVAALRLPARAERQMQVLMDLSTDGCSTTAQKEELENLVELSESIALLRAPALRLLGRKPESALEACCEAIVDPSRGSEQCGTAPSSPTRPTRESSTAGPVRAEVIPFDDPT